MRRTPSPLDLRALQAFVAVCETGSMTAAARRLGLSQSAVSQSIASLEREQGTALFDRDPNANKRAEPSRRSGSEVSRSNRTLTA